MFTSPHLPREITDRKVIWEWHNKATHTISTTTHTSAPYHLPPMTTTTSRVTTYYHRLNSTDDHCRFQNIPTTTTFASSRYSPPTSTTPPHIWSCSTPTLTSSRPRLVTTLNGLAKYTPPELLLPVKEDRAVSVSSHVRTKLLTELSPGHDSSSSLSPRRSNSSKPADPRVAAMHTSLSPRTHRGGGGVDDPEGVLQKQHHKPQIQASSAPTITTTTSKLAGDPLKRLSSREYPAPLPRDPRGYLIDSTSPASTADYSIAPKKRAATASIAAISTTHGSPSAFSTSIFGQPSSSTSVFSQSTAAPSTMTHSAPGSVVSVNPSASTSSFGTSRCAGFSAVTPPASQSSSPPASLHSNSSKSPRRRRRLMGLHNYGNTCYCNVILQGLLSCEEFCAYWLTKKSLRTNPASEFKSDLSKAWIDFLEETHEGVPCMGKDSEHCPTGDIAATQLKTLLNIIRAHHPQFVPGTQADAHEFLQVLLKALSTETHKAAKPRPSTDPPKKKKSRSKSRYALTESGSVDLDDLDAEQASECSWRQHKNELNSEVENMWRSQFMSKLVCRSCSKVRYRFEAEYDWDIEIPPGFTRPTLLDLLESSVTKEDVVEIMCPRCKVITSSTLKRAPYKLPGNYFCLQIKRFGYDRASGQTYRLNTPVSLPPEDIIDFAKYSCGPPDKGSCFELIGLTMQEGSLENGHYTGLHKISDATSRSNKNPMGRAESRWYLFSDETVREVRNPRSIIDGGAIYLLWFKRCPPTKICLPVATRLDRTSGTSFIDSVTPNVSDTLTSFPSEPPQLPSLSRRLAELHVVT